FMPRYDFQCKTCGEIFEATRTFATATDPAACPSCGQPAPRLLRMPTLVRSRFSAPDPVAAPARPSQNAPAAMAEPDEPLDPTKPHPAWRLIGDGCPCCPGGRHIVPPRPAASGAGADRS
ncbi:MAG: zinc ribbon domain-containing protein, partial [Thermomicrobiales bacterium]